MKENEEKKNIQIFGGFHFNGCEISNPTYQTVVQGDMKMEWRDDRATAPRGHGDTRIVDALNALLEAVDESGTRIFTEKGQWYAVYRVLKEHEGYPNVMRDFCDTMIDLGMGDAKVPISYQALKKAPLNAAIQSVKTTHWHSYLNRADAKAKKQIRVAMKLMELLEIEG